MTSIEERTWWQRNWKWVVAGLGAAVAVLAGGVVFAIVGSMKSSGAYEEGVARARATKEVASSDPLVGSWKLNLDRSHYGGGAEPRKQELFRCRLDGPSLKCTIDSLRPDGRQVVATFTAPYDGKPHPVAGIPDVDQVNLQRLDEFTADATFSFKGKPVFGYRAVRSADGRSLTVVSVDPTTRVVGSSVVVYDRE